MSLCVKVWAVERIATVALVFGVPSSQRQRSKLARTWPRSSVGARHWPPGYHTSAGCRCARSRPAEGVTMFFSGTKQHACRSSAWPEA